MILRHLFKKNTGLLIFNSLKQKKLIFNFLVNRNWKKLTGSRKRARILADNRKSHHPIETLISRNEQLLRRFHRPVSFQNGFGANLARVSFKSHKPLSKIYRPKKDYNFCLFSFYSVVDIPFLCKKNGPKMCLKINRSVKALKNTLLPSLLIPTRASTAPTKKRVP